MIRASIPDDEVLRSCIVDISLSVLKLGVSGSADRKIPRPRDPIDPPEMHKQSETTKTANALNNPAAVAGWEGGERGWAD